MRTLRWLWDVLTDRPRRDAEAARTREMRRLLDENRQMQAELGRRAAVMSDAQRRDLRRL